MIAISLILPILWVKQMLNNSELVYKLDMLVHVLQGLNIGRIMRKKIC